MSGGISFYSILSNPQEHIPPLSKHKKEVQKKKKKETTKIEIKAGGEERVTLRVCLLIWASSFRFQSLGAITISYS